MNKHPACIVTKYGWVELDHQNKIAVNCVTQKLHLSILESPFYKTKEDIFWPKVEKYDYQVDKKPDVIGYFKTDYIYHIVRYPEFTPRQFLESLLFLLDVCKYCK